MGAGAAYVGAGAAYVGAGAAYMGAGAAYAGAGGGAACTGAAIAGMAWPVTIATRPCVATSCERRKAMWVSAMERAKRSCDSANWRWFSWKAAIQPMAAGVRSFTRDSGVRAGGAVTVDLIAPAQPQESPGDGALPATIGIRIADHGIGMSPLQLARVCERFYRADTSGKISGTGLGMSIVKEIVELHGGNLDLDSTSGAGTAVTLWLQVLTQAVSEQPGGTLPAPASTQEMSS